MIEHDIEAQLKTLSDQVSNLTGEVKAMRDQGGNYITHSDLSAYLTVAAFDARIERLTVDILSRVTSTMQAMFNDAVKEATTVAIDSYTETEQGREWFREALAADRAQARKERIEDFAKIATSVKVIALWVVPVLTIANIVGQIFGWW